MILFDQLPTDENLAMSFEEDILGRDQERFNFIYVLDMMNCSASVSLEGNWDRGKIFFTKQARIILNQSNDLLKEDNNDYKDRAKLIIKE